MSSYRAYEFIRELGKGSYGDIVAIKCFTTETKDYASVQKGILMESTALRELRYENVVRMLHIFVENLRFYLVFEYMDKTLLDVIQEAPKKLLGCGPRTRLFCFQLLRALAFIHSKNFVHRDVKPENILIGSNNVLKLADFGFAIKNSHPGQRYSTCIATRWYRAPELLTGDYYYGRGVDVWAAGAVMVEMILGQPLAAGANDAEQIVKTIELVGDFPPHMLSRTRRKDLPTAVKNPIPLFAGLDTLLTGQPDLYVSLIKFCLIPDPQKRPGADALLLHSLFNHNDQYYPSDTIAEIRQNLVMCSRNTAARFQSFLHNRDLYKKAAREMLQNPNAPISTASMSRFRQMGMDEHVLRQMAEMISIERRFPPDFLTQSPELYGTEGQSQRDRAQQQHQPRLVEKYNLIGQSKPGVYFQSAGSKSNVLKREQPVQGQGSTVLWRRSEADMANSPMIQPSNPWSNFSVGKTFPSASVKAVPLTTNQSVTTQHLTQREEGR
ncbi:Cyclin-dependent kinase-like 2 [Hypsibius exemplaris]|uniref:Cyclin-dependent kinase-like 2 n=1 Tax=Hypsibius exemplaris TaxID=2072580 RepID=A0A1W0WW75_HYPEX|nr:Cyclin-dependent kinase-like 2 [Hypsibius exemplaris]